MDMPFRWLLKLLGRERKEPVSGGRALFDGLEPDLPDFLHARREIVFETPEMHGFLVRNVPTIAEGLFGRQSVPDEFRITFPYALVVLDMDTLQPRKIVALEKGGMGNLFLCLYAGDAHMNLGNGSDLLDRNAFLERALTLVSLEKSRQTSRSMGLSRQRCE
ncbi:hypothetical protein QVG61_06140 [Thiohalobacter sp. IOR34]|uniref:hypothetical protein n=1 Tax=Thiohalobacter sp. IOR34 TaxID=3057176 RepID=UPI0025B1A4B8|nr:hypothetical protein [Thiohalobacter sp. IOR34]WJW76664.1 hypothetical protein QVG61_06140 [Thiohalobacter sp. IOR34]